MVGVLGVLASSASAANPPPAELRRASPPPEVRRAAPPTAPAVVGLSPPEATLGDLVTVRVANLPPGDDGSGLQLYLDDVVLPGVPKVTRGGADERVLAWRLLWDDETRAAWKQILAPRGGQATLSTTRACAASVGRDQPLPSDATLALSVEPPPRVVRAEQPDRSDALDTVQVEVENVHTLLHRATGGLGSIVLVLDGFEVHGIAPRLTLGATLFDPALEPTATPPDLDVTGVLTYRLTYSEEAKPAYRALFARPNVRRWTRPVPVTLRLDGEPTAIASSVDGMLLRYAETRSLVLYGIVTASLALLFVPFSTRLLKTDGVYSLAKFQLAVWMAAIVASYGLIVAVVGEIDPLTPSVTGLLAISLVTTAAEGRPTAPPNKYWFNQLILDGGAYSLAKFQMVVWTVVLVVVFLAAVWNSMAMPEFSAGLLALMGISSATHVAVQDYRKPPPPAPPTLPG